MYGFLNSALKFQYVRYEDLLSFISSVAISNSVILNYTELVLFPSQKFFKAPMFTSLTCGVKIDTKQLCRHEDTNLHETIVA